MNPEAAITRAELLISQHRFGQAVELLHFALAGSPDNARAHSWLALCLAQDRDQLREATREAELAVHLAPDESFSHYILSLVWDYRNQNEQALAAIGQAIAIAPNVADFHGVKAHVLSKQRKWREALEAAETGLSHDPEDQKCAAIRVVALERLGRVGDALAESESAIRRDPDSADAHATRGWALLQKGQYRSAQESFREALRLEPSSEFARHGMIQALNSSNFFFRYFYRIMIWISRLDPRVQWGMIIGLWFGMQVLGNLSDRYPALKPWVFPISIFYLLFVMMSWIMHPLFNAFLRFHPFGKHLLSGKERWASNLIAGTILFGIVSGAGLAFHYGNPIYALLPILHAIYLTIPLSVAFNTDAQWATIVAILVAVGFGLLYVLNVFLLMGDMVIMQLMIAFTYGILIYCFVGQSLTRAEART